MPDRFRNFDGRWLPIASAVIFTALALHAARLETPTVDEFAHVPAGVAQLVHGRFDLYAKNPPLVRAWMALPVLALGPHVPEIAENPWDGWSPWFYGARFMDANRPDYFGLFFAARSAIVLLTLLTGLLVFVWARSLFGGQAAGFAVSLFLLCPPVLAHGLLATVDMGAALTILATCFALHWTYEKPSWLRVAIVGVALGSALLAKFTATLLLPALAIVLLTHRRRAPLRAVGEIALVLAVAFFSVNVFMRFRGSFAPLGSLALQSSLMQGLQQWLPAWLPLPLPVDYVLGWDAQKLDVELGEFGGYLFGSWSAHGHVGYNVVALLAKLPLPTVALAILAAVRVRRVRLRPRSWLELAAPAAVLLAGLTLFSKLDLGIRYLLPLLPLLFVFVGSLWAGEAKRLWTRIGRLVWAFSVATALFVHPHYLGHFSALFGGSSRGYRILADSNLDWGQDLYRLPRALEELGHSGKIWLLYFGHVDPALYGIEFEPVPRQPVEGIVAVSANFALGARYVAPIPDGRLMQVGPGHLAWLAGREPTMRLGSIWVYDLRRN